MKKSGMIRALPTIMAIKIIWIEGTQNFIPSFVPGLREKGYKVETVPNGKEAVKRIPSLKPDLAVVNAASLRSSGLRVCRTLREQLQEKPVLLIRNQAQPFVYKKSINKVLVLPFTIRKLLNRIQSLIPESKGKVLKYGPITLEPKCNLLLIDDKGPLHLTPKLTALLNLFLHHPGEVLERERLFQEIWETNYVGDLRTLDTHISWLRQQLEMDPKNPRFIKTVRGIGYRLD